MFLHLAQFQESNFMIINLKNSSFIFSYTNILDYMRKFYPPANPTPQPQTNAQYNTGLRKGHEYAVTFTLDPRKSDRYELLSFFYSATTDLCTKLHKVTSKFWIYPELTSLAGRLHWHAYVKIKDPIGWDYFVNYYNSTYGGMKTKICDDQRGWRLYCEKTYWNVSLLFKLYRNMKGEDGPEEINRNNWRRMLAVKAKRKGDKQVREGVPEKQNVLDWILGD